MNERLNIPSIISVVESLEQTHPARKLTALRYMAMHTGGRFDLPSPAGDYDPIIKSIELFGVYAMAEDAEDLPKNWIIAAKNILQADEVAAVRPAGPPQLGAEVRFQRSTTHHPEIGIVRGRQFGTGIIEVEDGNAEQVRLTPDQYETVTHANT